MLSSCNTTNNTDEVRLITLDPGHFHAALVQKSAYPQVSNTVYVYAHEGDDLREHLKRIEAYNNRQESPTHWNEVVYTGDDFLAKMLADKRGNVMVTSGNNGKKTDYIYAAVSAGINVLADKPMAIDTKGFELLKSCFEIAESNGVLLYDIMTERFEIATILQRELSQIPDIYGEQTQGTPEEPAVIKESVHHFFKTVSGVPLIRPAWFFDTKQQGEGIVDVTTHLVDLVQWECFPNQIIDYKNDIEIVDAGHSATPVSHQEFRQVTGLDEFPEFLMPSVRNDTLFVNANGYIIYRIKGVYAGVSVFWNYTYPEGGGDTHYSVMRGTKSQLIIEQGKAQNYIPELSVKVDDSVDAEAFEQSLGKAVALLSEKYSGIGIKRISDRLWRIYIPDSFRNGHEAHFGQVTENFLNYLKKGRLPEWETPNMIAKYYVTSTALEMAAAKD